MLFNSIDFTVFLPIVFILYWFVTVNDLRLQNTLVVVASYVFYGWWDRRFLSLIIISTMVDYLVSRRLGYDENPRKRKLLLLVSVFVNLGLLGFFKYYNFFLENFVTAFSFFGKSLPTHSLNIILPVGISFYTFQTLSYTIDVYKRKLEPTHNLMAFAAYVSFFPQLVAGPIERATRLLPQFLSARHFDYAKATDGMRQILWGLFKKIVIADNCARYANLIFNHSSDYGGSSLLLGALFFTFQIYGDFSGYSDIAIGTARLFGIDLMRNFNFPYFSRDIAEFWRRWHISLSTWFRDYVYIPLGGSRGNTLMKVRNIFIIFIVSGFWHGANWTFIIWGALNAVYFLPFLLTRRNRQNLDTVAAGKKLPTFGELLSMILTFAMTIFAWIFFRAENLHHATGYISALFSRSLFTVPNFEGRMGAMVTAFLVAGFMIVEWIGREGQFALANIGSAMNRSWRWTCYSLIILIIYFFGNFSGKIEFIYFQF